MAKVDCGAGSPDSALLVGAARSVWDGSDARMTIEIAVDERLVAEMESHGIERLERVFITDSDIRHIMKHHRKNEEDRGQIDIVPEDFGVIPEVLNGFDSCEHTDTDLLGNRKFEIVKYVDDVFYVVTVQRGRKRMEVRTMWKKPGASCQPSSGSLGPTSETTPASKPV